jgi:hypothetical protein
MMYLFAAKSSAMANPATGTEKDLNRLDKREDLIALRRRKKR